MDKWFDEMQYLTLLVGRFNIENLKCKRRVWHSYSGLAHFSHNIDFEELLYTIFNHCWCENTFALKKCSIYPYFQSSCQESSWDDAFRMCVLACLLLCLSLQTTAATLKLLSINYYALPSNVCGTGWLLLTFSIHFFNKSYDLLFINKIKATEMIRGGHFWVGLSTDRACVVVRTYMLNVNTSEPYRLL